MDLPMDWDWAGQGDRAFLRGDGIMCEMGPNQNSAVRTKKGPKDQQKKATMTCQLGEIRQKFWKMRRALCALPSQ